MNTVTFSETPRFRTEAIDEARGDESVERLAARLGVSRQTVENWRRGMTRPAFADVCRLAAMQGRPLDFYATKGGESSAAAA